MSNIQNLECRCKVVMTGPPGMGKTTIRKVFFDKKKPDILKKNIQPTMGFRSNIYNFFDIDISLFDLAGQENYLWFGVDKSVFEGSSIIACVFDIQHPFKLIIEYLELVFNLMSDLNLEKSRLITLLHKIDLVTPQYTYLKITSIKNYFKRRNKEYNNFEIFNTSIYPPYYWQTLEIILKLLLGNINQVMTCKYIDAPMEHDILESIYYNLSSKTLLND